MPTGSKTPIIASSTNHAARASFFICASPPSAAGAGE